MNVTSGQPRNTASASTPLTGDQRQLVDQFFIKLERLYGRQKFAAAYPDEGALATAKKEWGPDIAKMSVPRLVKLFDDLKGIMHQEPYSWPGNVAAILKASTMGDLAPGRSAAAQRIWQPERRLVDKGKRERSVAAGEKAVAEMRRVLGE